MYSIDSNKEYCITLHLVGYTQKYINDARSLERQMCTSMFFLSVSYMFQPTRSIIRLCITSW